MPGLRLTPNLRLDVKQKCASRSWRLYSVSEVSGAQGRWFRLGEETPRMLTLNQRSSGGRIAKGPLHTNQQLNVRMGSGMTIGASGPGPTIFGVPSEASAQFRQWLL